MPGHAAHGFRKNFTVKDEMPEWLAKQAARAKKSAHFA
jgi:hypothetical protein